MDEALKSEIIGKAREYWMAGRTQEAGTLIFEHIPVIHRPIWAANVLAVACSDNPTVPEIEAVLDFARNPEQWRHKTSNEAHGVFNAVRWRAINLPSSGQIYDKILSLAEDTAKVTYNAYQYSAPFDHWAGWYIAVNLKHIEEQVGALR